MDLQKYNASSFKGLIEETVRLSESIRAKKDITFAEIVQAKHQITLDSFYNDLGIDLKTDTIHNIFTTPTDSDIRWIIPELIRDTVTLGYRAAPIWPNVTITEERTTGLEQVLPNLNMSDAAPKKLGETETIPLGTISWGSKKFSIYKMGRGISVSYEVLQYVSLNVLQIFLRDFGVKLGHGMDVLAIDALINGEQADGSNSAPVIGVKTPGTKVYRDMLKAWIRLGRIGRSPQVMIGGEAMAEETLDMSEFKNRIIGTSSDSGAPVHNLNMNTPIPQTTDYYIHGNVPANQELMIDRTAALIKLVAQPILVESEKIVSNQTNAWYVTTTTGFAKLFRDSVIVLDKSKDFASYGFPAYMEVDALQNVQID